ncbi:MAG: HTH-type transcriptional repressor of NAD biosynthesis genes [Flavobacteriaceae bacterium]|jgi:HTH-type transcriptional repressor of NAD biosynthesis genes|tara:strand:- start:4075 stop:4647 length:573 start_codon:yes stop_codon:yes gene_type:complete
MEKNIKQQKSNCLRVVLFGPESTGKTTMAKALAEFYETAWVPEFARNYLQKKWDKDNSICTLNDLLVIAEEQIKAENKSLENANKVLFCDTNVLVTQAWSETHFDGYCDAQLKEWANAFQYDHYFLTGIDVPWQADDLRDRPEERNLMFRHFEYLLKQKNVPYSYLTGPHETRLKSAIEALNPLIIQGIK